LRGEEMLTEAQKITQVKAVLESEPEKVAVETISLALSIEDAENRDLTLLELTAYLAGKRDWNKAIGVAQMIEASYEKTDALHYIAAQLSKAGDLERSLWFFNEAEKEARRCDFYWQQAELLQKLAKSLVETGATSKANELLEKSVSVAQKGQDSPNLQDSLDAASVLSESILILASFTETETAVALAETIKNTAIRERTLRLLFEHSSREKLVA